MGASAHDHDGLEYAATGAPEIELDWNESGISLRANADGLRSLAALLHTMADRDRAGDHIHLEPGMHLLLGSERVVIAHRSADDPGTQHHHGHGHGHG